MSDFVYLPPESVELPMLPLRDVVVFPHMVIPLFVGRAKSIAALEAAMEAGRSVMLVAQKTAAQDEPAIDDMFGTGCVASILQLLKLPDGTVRVVAEGPPGSLQAFAAWLHEGPPAARVEFVDLREMNATGEFSTFEVRG